MASPRFIPTKTLRLLSASGRRFRQLHMTSAATAPSRILSTEKPVTDNAGLKAESNQLAADITHQTRTLNTTHNLAAPSIDAVYFPQFSAAEHANDDGYDASFRVPRLPLQFFPPKGGSTPAPSEMKEEEPTIQRTIINTVAGDSSHISAGGTLAEVHDASTTVDMDFESMVDKMDSAAEEMTQKVKKESPEAAGLVRQVWNGLLDDLFGARKKKEEGSS